MRAGSNPALALILCCSALALCARAQMPAIYEASSDYSLTANGKAVKNTAQAIPHLRARTG